MYMKEDHTCEPVSEKASHSRPLPIGLPLTDNSEPIDLSFQTGFQAKQL